MSGNLSSLRCFIIVALLSIAAATRAQKDPLVLQFDKNGKLSSFPPGKIERGKIINIEIDEHKFKYHLSDQPDGNYRLDTKQSSTVTTLTADQIKKIKKQLRERIQQSLYNLYDSAALRSFYKNFFGEKTYDEIVVELERMVSKLNNPENTDTNFVHFRDLYDLVTRLDTNTTYEPYEVAVFYNVKKAQYEITIISKDYLHDQLISYLRTAVSGSRLGSLDIDRDYRKAWQEIDDWNRKFVADSVELRNFKIVSCDPPPESLVELSGFTEKILENSVVKSVLEDKPCFESFLWFNNSYFSTNPIGFTTKDREWYQYPVDSVAAKMHDRFIIDKINTGAYCCKLSVDGVDSLIRRRNSGIDNFQIKNSENDRIWGINSFDDLEASGKTINKLYFPVCTNPQRPQLLLQYDASNEYYANPENGKIKSVTETDSVVVLIHNIPSNIKVSFSQGSQATPNTSEFQDVINTAFSGASNILTNSSQSQLNPTSVHSQKTLTNTHIIPPPTDGMDNKTRYFKSGYHGAQKRNFSKERERTTPKLVIAEHARKVGVKIDDELLTYYCDSCWRGPKQMFVDTLSTQTVADLVNSYNKFLENINHRTKLLQLFIDVEWIRYLAITLDRSLPPRDLKSATDTNAQFSTLVSRLAVVDSTRIITYSATQKKRSDKDASETSVLTGTVRVGKKIMFQLSAGAALTFGNFYQKTATSNGSQISVSTNSQSVSFVVGAHIYPWKLFLIDNSFAGIKSGHILNRLSAYLGLGLPNPLQNYYAGVGIDLVPGLKLVAGVHLYENFMYQVQNDQIVDTKTGIKAAGPFISLNIDPTAFVSLLGIFK